MIAMDPTNPGQFFACCGLLELAHRHTPGVRARFENGAFCTDSPQGVGKILNKLRNTEFVEEKGRGTPGTHPVRLVEVDITLDWWMDSHPLKLWAGKQRPRKIFDNLRKNLPGPENSKDDLFNLFNAGRPMEGRLGVDPRTAWNTLDVGYSPNTQEMSVTTFPAVELLAAIGLQRFRPREEGQGKTPMFGYATWSTALPVSVARPASAGLLPAGEMRAYRFRVARRGNYKSFTYARRLTQPFC